MTYAVTTKRLAGIILGILLLAQVAGCGKKPPLSLFPLVSKEDIERGSKLYSSHCQPCHGTTEVGNLPRFKPFADDPVTKGDTLVLASSILYNKAHLTKAGGPYLFEGLTNSEIAHIANYMRSAAGVEDVPMRTKTIERAREIQAEKTGKKVARPALPPPPPPPPSMMPPTPPPSFNPPAPSEQVPLK